ncbi:hypothetical protein RCL1_001862 [Eukaryota sp. TZLM3-RCL]
MRYIVSLISLLIIAHACSHYCPESERQSLVILYERLNGDNWTNTWPINDTTSDHCNWHGIECTQNRVVTINLQNNNLEGRLPYEIGCFSSLRTLMLQQNNISGFIPSSIDRDKGIPCLQSLQVVDLSENALKGRIPRGFCNLSQSLQFLYLNDNGLGGEIPDCFDNRFSASLRTLRVNCNKIRGELPEGFWDMGVLNELWIHCTRMETVENPPEQLVSFIQGDENCSQICSKPQEISDSHC